MASRTKRILIGCGIGCGSLVLVAIIAAVAFGAWISGKGELLEPQRLLGAETTGYAEWTLRLEDPGTEGFVQLLIEALEAERAGNAQRLPQWLRQILLNRRNRDSTEEIRQLFPIVAAWTLSPAGDEMLFSISPTGLGNRLVFADWVVGMAARWSGKGFAHAYRDEKIYRLPDDGGQTHTFFLRSGTVFFTTDLQSAKTAVDRMQQEEATQRQPGLLDPLFAETTGERTLRGALLNRRGELRRLLEPLASRDDLELIEPIRGVTLEGGLHEDGGFTALLGFRGPDRAWAEREAERLRRRIEELLAPSGLEPEVDASTAGDVVRLEVRAEDLIGKLWRWIEAQERRSGVRINL